MPARCRRAVVEPLSERTRWLPPNSDAVAPISTSDVAGALEVGRDDRVGIGDVGDGGDDQRRRHAVARAVGAEVLVVQRVLAADERCAVRHRRLAASGHGDHQIAERGGPTRVAPREVVHQRDRVGVGADGDDVADRLVDHGVGHALGSATPYHGLTPMPMAMPVRVGGLGQHDAVGVARRGATPISGRTTVVPRISWS